jgi:hypothetical protein
MNIDSFVDLFAFTVYVTAAKADATAEQAEALRATILPLLDRFRAGDIDEDVIFRQVDEVMGPDWNPAGAWADQLDALGFAREDTGKE